MKEYQLALSDEILMKVEKPARYIGNEVNSIVKTGDENVKIRYAMCFPDVYEIGMSHLGMKILYDMLNQWEDVWCERVFSPWVDLDKIMREEKIPLFALESQQPIKEFDFLGITIQYEMCYTNILQILDLAAIPFRNKERTWEHPIVMGGGPCTYNPEPIADFFDIFYIGEGETRYREVLDLYLECKENGTTREEFLRKAALIPGMYVPMFYQVAYHEDGTISEFGPIYEELPTVITKEMVKDVSNTYYPMK
ncbi:MAG: B12-binding domain-containing radical SAM protein, partial [Lachnospiraceae bacterium]|nr:B12-binding domain-containing radical SAM protein [Lachnospiraceae bacterium]